MLTNAVLLAPLLTVLLATSAPAQTVTGAWELMTEWTGAAPALDGDHHRLDELLAQQNNIVIMHDNAAVLIVDDDGASRQSSTDGRSEHQCWRNGCVEASTTWSAGRLQQQFTLSPQLRLLRTFAPSEIDQLIITISAETAEGSHLISRRTYSRVGEMSARRQ